MKKAQDEFLRFLLERFDVPSLVQALGPMDADLSDGAVPDVVVKVMDYFGRDQHDIVRYVHKHAAVLTRDALPDVYWPEFDIATKYPHVVQDAYVPKPYKQYTFAEVMTKLKTYLPVRIGICGPRAVSERYPQLPCVLWPRR